MDDQSQSDSETDRSVSERQPSHSPQQIGDMLLSFYKFLTTLHYHPKDLKVPPPTGWQQFTPEACAHFRNDQVVRVLRHLPFLKPNVEADFHFKCKLIDYTQFEREHFVARHHEQDPEEWWSSIDIIDAEWMLPLAAGYESFGREFSLNVLDCEINMIILKASVAGPVGLEHWIDEMQDAYRSLQLIPCPGRVTMVCDDVPEREEGLRITEAELRAQTEDWPTDMDVQFIRQVYRDYGWPHAFQREAAFSYVCKLLEDLDGMKRYWEWATNHDPRIWARPI